MTALMEGPVTAEVITARAATVKVADLRKALSTVATGKVAPWNLLRVGVSHKGALSVEGADPTYDTFTRATLGEDVTIWSYVVADADMVRRSLRGAKGTVTVTVHGDTLTIGHVTLEASPHASGFATEPAVHGMVVHKSAADLAWLATAAAKWNDPGYSVLQSVVISEGDMATTNRYQLHAVLTTPAIDSVLVNVKALTTMLKGKPDSVAFTYATGTDAQRVGVSYTAGALTVVGSVAATIGNFPKWRDLIPQSQNVGIRACVPAAQLRAAVTDVGAVLDRNRPVRLVFADGAIRVHSGSPEDGPYAERVVPLSHPIHDTFTVAFSPAFLANVLAGFDGDAWMASDDPNCKPSVFTGNDTDRVGLIMPVKI